MLKTIDGIVPIDEDHRKRLEKTRRAIERIREETARELAADREHTAALQDRVARTRELTALRIENGREITAALQAAFVEQAALIDRIAGRRS